MTHSPTPWEWSDTGYARLRDARGDTVVWYTTDDDGLHAAPEDAAHIVLCVNSHAALVEALKAWVRLAGWKELPNPDDFEITESKCIVWRQTIAALAAAKGEA